MKIPQPMLTRESLKTILERIDHAVIIADKEANFVLWNNTATRLLGMTADIKDKDEWQNHFKIFKPDHTMYNSESLPIMRALNGEDVKAERLYISNTQVHLQVDAFPVKSPEGVILGAAASFKDITDNIRINQMVDELQATFEKMKILLGHNFFS